MNKQIPANKMNKIFIVVVIFVVQLREILKYKYKKTLGNKLVKVPIKTECQQLN
jgi:hypothetical protein